MPPLLSIVVVNVCLYVYLLAKTMRLARDGYVFWSWKEGGRPKLSAISGGWAVRTGTVEGAAVEDGAHNVRSTNQLEAGSAIGLKCCVVLKAAVMSRRSTTVMEGREIRRERDGYDGGSDGMNKKKKKKF